VSQARSQHGVLSQITRMLKQRCRQTRKRQIGPMRSRRPDGRTIAPC
jgi:hypothetical protein